METGSRQLKMEIPPTSVSRLQGDPEEWTTLTSLNGWQTVPSAQVALYWKGTIDLSGWVAEKLTFFPSAGFIQEGPYWISQDGPGQFCTTIVSTVPLDPYTVLIQTIENSGPGMLGVGFTNDQQNYETNMFCETQVNLVNSTNPSLGICTPITSKQTGSLEPTASDTLYVLKLVYPFTSVPAYTPPAPVPPTTMGLALLVPASRIIISGRFAKEDDTVYLMRLKRSLELQQLV